VDKKGGACSRHEREKKCIQAFGIYGKIILKSIFKK
jgi:hypothetical protein